MKKSEILGQIELLIFENTFSEISMSKISAMLNMQKASLYYYFKSKESLQNELIEFSFQKYKTSIEEIFSNKEKGKLIGDFFNYIGKEKNLFSHINQNGYCSNENIKQDIQEKNKIIFKIVEQALANNFSFNTEKSFLFFSILQDISIKKCIFGDCELKTKNLEKEMINIF